MRTDQSLSATTSERCENQVGFGVLNAAASKGTAAGSSVSVARL